MFAVLGRLLIRLGSATALVTMLAAVPAGLATYIGWPLPHHMPSGDELTSFLTQAIGDQAIIDAIAVLLWLVWALFTIAVVVEAAAAIRGVQAPRVRALGPLQGLASILVTGLTASVIASSALIPPTAASIFGPPATATAASASIMLQASPDRPVLLTTAAPETSPRLHTVGTVTLVIDGCGYEHKVVKNESLWRIAELCLGDPHRWPEIWELNKGKYWPHVSGTKAFTNPDVIFPGWVIDLPAGAALPPQTTSPAPPIQPTTPQTPAPSASASPSAPEAATASATTQPSAPATAGSEDGVVELIPTPTGSLSPSANPSPSTPVTSSTAADTPDEPPTVDDGVSDGVTLPGGWISAALGAALVTAVAWVWKRRRQRYMPTPISHPESETDPGLAPPLAARTLIRQTLRRAHPEALRDPEPGPTVRQFTSAEVKPALPETGPSGTELAGASTLPRTAGMGLVGDGAHDAARGLLVAVLASGHPEDPDAQGRAIVPAATLATLLGVSAVDLGPMHRLTIAASFTDAVGLIEEEIIRRSRIVAEAHVADVQALRAEAVFAEPVPQLLLIADTPEPASQARLLTAIGLGERLHIGAALLGTWQPGTTLTVNTDGTTTGGDGQRLAVLSADAAADTITMLREAHGDTIAAPAEDNPVRPAAGPTEAAAKQLRSGGEPAPAQPAAAEQPARRVQVRVLGPAALLDTTGAPAPKMRAKSLELLVYLSLHRKGAPLDQIMEAIWPDVTLRSASQGLSTCVGNLRGAIRTAAHGHAPAPDRPRLEPVINSGGHYRLDPAIVAVDWWTVLDETAQVATASSDQHKLAHLQAAIAVLQGPLADGADYEWIDTDREHVRRTQIRIYAQAAELLTHTDPHQARTLLDTACDIDPLSEELARRAMQASAALGDLDGIRHRLDTIRRDLDDAGTELETDLEQLAATLIKHLHHARREDN